MKVTVHGPAAGVIWDGTVRSWMPDEPLEIDDGDKDAVKWAQAAVASGLADLVEDVKAKETKAPAAKQASSRA